MSLNFEPKHFLYVYEITPMDFGWDNLLTTKQMFEDQVLGPSMQLADSAFLAGVIREFADTVEQHHRAAESCIQGFEHEMRGTDFSYFVLPDEFAASVGMTWKLHNNGTTIVVSPVRLPHLETCCGTAAVFHSRSVPPKRIGRMMAELGDKFHFVEDTRNTVLDPGD